jgi:hypothetical protein
MLRCVERLAAVRWARTLRSLKIAEKNLKKVETILDTLPRIV